MADTVDVQMNKGTAYTWKTSPFMWKDAIKSWKDASPNQYTVNRLSYISIAEKLCKVLKIKQRAALHIADELRKTIKVKRRDNTRLADKILKKVKHMSGKERIKVTEKAGRHPKLKNTETDLHITDRKVAKLHTLLYEKIRTTETYWDNIKFNLHVLEMFKTRDIAKKHTGHKLYDKLTVKDSIRSRTTKRIREVVKAVDLIRKREAKNLKDAARLVDSLLRRFKLIPKENLGLSDKLRKNANLKRKDGFKISDEFLHHAIMWLAFEENIMAFDKALKIYEAHYGESFETADTYSNKTTVNKQETATLTDVFGRLYIIRRTIEDNIMVAELLKKQYAQQAYENVKIYDAFIKACEAVLSNLAIRYGELDDEGLMKLVNAPSGYTDFTDFKVGEYEYEEALVRIVLETKVPQSPASVADVVLHVDIPDTDDRGITQITDTTAATKVRFNKHYYNPPEVNVVLRAGSTANSNVVPYIVSTDGQDDIGRYFEVELIAANGERTTGTISWVSKGY